MSSRGNAPMPPCGACDQQRILDAIKRLGPADRASAMRVAGRLGLRGLCRAMHGMRRWYTGQTAAVAQMVIGARPALLEAMDLSPPVGAYRGFKVDRGSPIACFREGIVFDLGVERNGGCSSWTLDRARADKFSGASKGKVGVVVQLASGAGAVPFIAPPERTKPWFDRLYKGAIAASHRYKEREYAIFGKRLRVRVVKIKR